MPNLFKLLQQRKKEIKDNFRLNTSKKLTKKVIGDKCAFQDGVG